MRVLGISAFYHDSAAALVDDGEIVAAAQEERFTRKKYDARYPRNAIAYCLEQAGIGLDKVDRVAFYDKPFLKFERLLETYVSFAPRGFASFRMALPLWLREKLFQKPLLVGELKREEPGFDWENRLLFSEHHLSHAASAFYPSPFARAAVLTLDGVGEWATTAVAIGDGRQLAIHKEIHFPHSLGLLYSAFTYHTGFRVNSGEYKLMGLAPYGTPRFVQVIRDHLIDLKPDGSFRLNLDYFDYCTGLTMTNARFDALFGGKPRQPHELLEQRHMDMAASVQAVLEEAVLRLTADVARETECRNLCLAGGVALNCVANGKVLREGRFDNIWIQPAAGDAGGALGAALAAFHLQGGGERTVQGPLDAMKGGYLGPSFDQDEIERRLTAAGARFTSLDQEAMLETVAGALADGQAVGWFQGRMEFGPRALGNRSILADPRNPATQKTLNLKVKYRESFRPFAPSVLREHAPRWFDLAVDSPYMLLVTTVAEQHRKTMTTEEQALFGIDKLNVVRSTVPAITHVDYSARVQTVHRETNPLYHALVSRFHALTGCPILVNTSFNIRSEPVVCTPEDAFRCFMGCEIDMLVVGNAVLRKQDQDPALRVDYRDSFEQD
ncbi:carbamoyltransferase [Bradyrhizobium liaoningense]|uniref:carbamoyltransferase family protein n=1 Tax=Bradyrhizobium liaoningense TaxID=43992 RepID=UPI001BA610C2|nr:carbamoyltransferase [Bradyrhizobium liaoningense]MBR0714741.1 carbamoyltransferase [Bradyrhizobium liaoningense]